MKTTSRLLALTLAATTASTFTGCMSGANSRSSAPVAPNSNDSNIGDTNVEILNR